MHDGEVVQQGTPVELFERPRHTFVGHFIGSPGMNLMPCELENGAARGRGAKSGARAAGIEAPSPAAGWNSACGRSSSSSPTKGLPSRWAASATPAATASSRPGLPIMLAGNKIRVLVPEGQPVPEGRAASALRSRAHADLRRRLDHRMSEQDPKPTEGLVPGAAGGGAGGLQRHHPADDRRQLLGAGDLRRQPVLLRGREVVRTGAALRALPRRAAAPAAVHRHHPRHRDPAGRRPSRWPCRARASGSRSAWC